MSTRGAHRDKVDIRICLAFTDVKNQSTVFVNDQLWAVRGSGDTHPVHPAGPLINTTGSKVRIQDIPVIVHGPDHARPDQDRPDPYTASGSTNVFAYRIK